MAAHAAFLNVDDRKFGIRGEGAWCFHFFLIIIFEVRASALLIGTEDKADVFL